nr:MAG TPA: Large Terminase [Bacteriophage sp.]
MLIKERKIWTPDDSFLLKYREEIESGNIIAGWELRQELTNLKEDFSNDEYFYNTDDALLRMDFMENCVKLTKSPFYGQPMVLMLWQKAFIEAVYSFKMSEESLERGMMIDRFKKILLLIARKNTKSETCSAIAVTELFVGNEGADIVCSSNDDNQASITYDAIDTMRQLIDPRDLDSKKNQRFIRNKNTNSKVFKLSDKTKNKEGRNIDFAIVDETHEMKTNVIGKSIEQSQSLKDNPKFVDITTEGFVQEGYLDDELEKGRGVINGEDDTKAGKRLLPWLYTQDSEQEVFTNPKSWMKSNPTLGVIKKVSYLEEQVELAKKSKGDRIFVLAKDFNIKQNSVEMWLNLEDYNFDATYDLEEFRGAPCLGAVDLAETMDLCCAKVLLMNDDGKKYIHTMYFVPERKIEDDDDSCAGAKYADWARDGYITVTEGSDIDLTVVADWFWSLYKEYGIRLMCCGYDQKFAKDFLRQMSEYGWTKEGGELELILQNAMTLDTANKFVETDLKKRNINYNNNPVDRWCFGNAGLSVDNKGKCLVVKTARNKKIDGAVTTVILYETYRRYRADLKRMVKEWRQSDGMAGEDNLES